MTSDEILSIAREAGLIQFSCDQKDGYTRDGVYVDQLAKFAELFAAKERAARIEAQQRLADTQELAAKSGLAHRMAVQRCVHAAVAEAVAAEREACKSIAIAEQKTMCEIALSHPDGSASRDRLFARSRSAESIAKAIEKRGA